MTAKVLPRVPHPTVRNSTLWHCFSLHRWGDGEGIFNYSHEAKEILRACVHKGENGRAGAPIWNRDNKLILFVPGSDFTDASYHLPHFYELFAKWAYEEDRDFFAQAAKASRDYIAKSCHPVTGMNPEYGEFDGSPMSRPLPWAPKDMTGSTAMLTAQPQISVLTGHGAARTTALKML